MTDWPGFSADQVPTILHYTDEAREENLWGYEIPTRTRESPEPLRWFKLLLKERPQDSSIPVNLDHKDFASSVSSSGSFETGTERKATPAQRTEVKMRQLGVDLVTVIKDFLEKVRHCTLKCIGNSYHSDFVARSNIEYIVTVPAVWSDSAKDKMVRALEAAGYGKHRDDFNLISESEAAAAYTFKAIQTQSLKVF